MKANMRLMGVVALMALVGVLTGWLASRAGASAPRVVPVPAGIGAEMDLRVPGAVNAAPSIAARWPFVVVAWTAATASDAAVYVATSVDNGASFSPPRVVEATRTHEPGLLAPRALMGWGRMGAEYEPLMPELHVVWHAGSGSSAALQAVKSADGGRSFVAEAMDGERPVDVPAESQRMPGPERMRQALAGESFGQAQGAYDECGTLLVVWDSNTTGVSRVAMRRLVEGPKGAQQVLQTMTLSGLTPANRPSVAGLRGGVIVGWTSGSVQASAIAMRRVGLESICQIRTVASAQEDSLTPAPLTSSP